MTTLINKEIMSNFIKIIPEEWEFISLFESLPFDSSPEDGYYCYKYQQENITFTFSFDIFETSVQTKLELNGVPIETVLHEDAEKITIINNIIYVTFNKINYINNLKIQLSPLNIEWSSLKL